MTKIKLKKEIKKISLKSYLMFGFFVISMLLFVFFFRWLGLKGIVGYIVGSFMTAFVLIWFLYKKNDTVKTFISLLEDKK